MRLLFLTKHLTRHTGTATAGKRRPGTGADGCVTFPAGQSGLSSALPGAGDHPCLQTALDPEAWQRPTEGTLPGATGTHMGSPPSLMQIGWFPGSPSLFMSKFSPHKFPPWSVSFVPQHQIPLQTQNLSLKNKLPIAMNLTMHNSSGSYAYIMSQPFGKCHFGRRDAVSK